MLSSLPQTQTSTLEFLQRADSSSAAYASQQSASRLVCRHVECCSLYLTSPSQPLRHVPPVPALLLLLRCLFSRLHLFRMGAMNCKSVANGKAAFSILHLSCLSSSTAVGGPPLQPEAFHGKTLCECEWCKSTFFFSLYRAGLPPMIDIEVLRWCASKNLGCSGGGCDLRSRVGSGRGPPGRDA